MSREGQRLGQYVDSRKRRVSLQKNRRWHTRLWKVSVEVEAPPIELLNRVLRERHIWDDQLIKWRVVHKLDSCSEIFNYNLGVFVWFSSLDLICDNEKECLSKLQELKYGLRNGDELSTMFTIDDSTLLSKLNVYVPHKHQCLRITT
uniref:Uncharacterized protein n=1 Tax=Strigamia maritima TaxID=126957 RepID=T1IJW2_STRMM